MSSLLAILNDAAAFLAIIAILVLVHELGHYLAARANGVKVEVFSIGLGPELCGRNDRAGTRWRLGAIPIGGYIKLYDHTVPGGEAADRAVSFEHKGVGQRAAIVAAGPLANFLLAFVVLVVLLELFGHPAEQGRPFLDELLWLAGRAAALTFDLSAMTLKAILQFLAGAHGGAEVIGPVRAAEVSGALSRESGPLFALWLAMFSINLGVTNLLPIPSLDGGHLLFCAVEAICGQPLDRRVCRYSARVGLALVVGLTAFATVNDLVRLGTAGG